MDVKRSRPMDEVNDNVAVELLLRLKHHHSHASSPSSMPSPPPPPPPPPQVQLVQQLMSEKEKLCNKVIDLEKLLDSKEFEVKQLQGALQIKEDDRIEHEKEMKLIQKDLEEKQKHCDQLQHLYQTLITKERISFDELNAARNMFIQTQTYVELQIMEQKKTNQLLLQLVQDQSIEMEKLYNKIIELEKQVDSKHKLELEIKRLQSALQVREHMEEMGKLYKKIIELKNQLDSKHKLELEIKQLQGALQVRGHIEEDDSMENQKTMKQMLEDLYHTFITKERISNDKLNGARKMLIQVFNEFKNKFTFNSQLAVKGLGDIVGKPFYRAAKRKYPDETSDVIEVNAFELSSEWENFQRDPSSHPSKVIVVEKDSCQSEMATLEQEKVDQTMPQLAEQHKVFNELNIKVTAKSQLGVKRMGDIDGKPFFRALKTRSNKTSLLEKSSLPQSTPPLSTTPRPSQTRRRYESVHVPDFSPERRSTSAPPESDDLKANFEKLRLLYIQCESTALEHQKIVDKYKRLTEDGKNEVMDLKRKIVDLEKELKSKESLENEIKELKGFIRLMKKMGEDEVKDVENKMNTFVDDLKEKDSDLDQMRLDYQTVITKDRRSNDELQEVKDALVKGLREVEICTPNASIGVKRMGELDLEPFQSFTKRRHLEGAEERAAMLHTRWEARIRNSEWHPFKIVDVGRGNVIGIIDEDDRTLKYVKRDLGVQVYEAVKRALTELNEYNPSGRYIVPELWNFEENRKARSSECATKLRKWTRCFCFGGLQSIHPGFYLFWGALMVLFWFNLKRLETCFALSEMLELNLMYFVHVNMQVFNTTWAVGRPVTPEYALGQGHNYGYGRRRTV
ncbi:hypothetical protein ACFE04_014953 [Oxalis oulophora]